MSSASASASFQHNASVEARNADASNWNIREDWEQVEREGEGGEEKDVLLPFDHGTGDIAPGVNRGSGRPWRRRPLLQRTADVASLARPSRWFRPRSRPGDTASRPSTWRDTMRAAFNYPQADVKLRKTAWLDALRGLAALEVYIFHYTDGWVEKVEGWGPAPDNKPTYWWTAPFLRSFYAAGSAAVCLFFAISGYVLTIRILRLIRRRQVDEVLNSLASAVMRRGIRLYLPVYITTFLLLNMEWAGFPRPMSFTFKETYTAEVWRWWEFVIKGWMPLRFPDRFDELLNFYDGTISWTIPIEYYGSLVTYVALLLTSKITTFRIRAPLFLVFVAAYTIKDEWYVVQFLIGMMYAEWQLIDAERLANPAFRRGLWHRRLQKPAAVALLVFGFYLWGVPEMRYGGGDMPGRPVISRPGFDWLFPIVFYFQWYDTRQVDRYYQSLAANCILVGVGELVQAQRLLEKPPFQYLGKISFGLYLSHIWVREGLRPLDDPLLALVGLDTRVDKSRQPMSLAYCAAFTLRMAIATPINFAVAGVFERTVDRASVALAKRFEQTLLRLNDRWSNGGGGVNNGGMMELAERP